MSRSCSPTANSTLPPLRTLRAALDRIENAERLVLDLRGLSFIDSTGLRLLVALHQRAQRDGFQLTLVAPAAPADKAIQLSGLDQALPFVAADDVVDREPQRISTQAAFDDERAPQVRDRRRQLRKRRPSLCAARSTSPRCPRWSCARRRYPRQRRAFVLDLCESSSWIPAVYA